MFVGGILRFFQVLLYCVGIGAIILFTTIIISKGIQLFFRAMGKEIGSFGSWFFGLFKKKVK